MIKKIKDQLRQYAAPREFARVFRLLIRFISIPYYLITIRYFAFKHKINKENYVLFFSGSTGDMFYMARLLDLFADKYGNTIAIAPKQYNQIFRLLSDNTKVNYIWLDDTQIENLRKAFDLTTIHQEKGLAPGNIRPVFLSLYHNLHSLIMADRLTSRDAFTWIMGLDKNSPYRYVLYGKVDEDAAIAILEKAEKKIGAIALINPICYTHKSINVDAWEGIAEALIKCGYKPVFNLKRNANDNKRSANDQSQYIVPAGYPIVEIPAYLVPVCADMIGLGCARHGGGFDLLYSFNKKNTNSLLISVSPKVPLSLVQKPDAPYDTISEFYEVHSGKKLTYNVLLDSDNDKKEAYEKVMRVLNPSFISF